MTRVVFRVFFLLLPKSYFLFGWKETMDAFEFTWKQETILSLKKLMATLGCLEFVVTRHPRDDINNFLKITEFLKEVGNEFIDLGSI